MICKNGYHRNQWVVAINVPNLLWIYQLSPARLGSDCVAGMLCVGGRHYCPQFVVCGMPKDYYGEHS